MSSQLIHDVQARLVAAGLLTPDKADGLYGPNTEAAVALAGGVETLFRPDEALGTGGDPEGTLGPAGKPELPPLGDDCAWLLKAREEVAVTEADHPERVIEYGQGRTSSPETPWCAAFLNWILAQVGIEGTGSLRARSFETWGKPAELEVGAIAVYPSHVAIVSVVDEQGRVWVTGGDQSNRVSQSSMLWYGEPVAYRRPPAVA